MNGYNGMEDSEDRLKLSTMKQAHDQVLLKSPESSKAKEGYLRVSEPKVDFLIFEEAYEYTLSYCLFFITIGILIY